MVKTASSLPPGYKYWAFISYSHRDEKWASWLQKELETLAIPKTLVGTAKDYGKVPGSLYPIFLDREELAAQTNLPGSVKEALKQSLTLIVVCSPHSARSYWVNLEIAYFKTLGREDRVICLIVDGEPHASINPQSGLQECFPDALLYRLNSKGQLVEGQAEPIAADVRSGKDSKRNALLKVAAGVLQVGFGDLKQRDRERQMRRLQIGGAVMAALVLLFAGLAVLAYNGKSQAERERQTAVSRQLAMTSTAKLDSAIDTALLFGVEAYRTKDIPDSRSALLAAVQHSDGLGRTLRGHTESLDYGAQYYKEEGLAFSPDGKALFWSGRNDVGPMYWLLGDSRVTAFSPLIEKENTEMIGLTISPNGRTFVTVETALEKQAYRIVVRNNDGFWNNPGKMPTYVMDFKPLPILISAVRYSPDSSMLALAAGNDLYLIDASTGLMIANPIKLMENIESIAFSKDGGLLLLIEKDGTMTAWNTATHRQVGIIETGHKLGDKRLSQSGDLLAIREKGLTVAKVSTSSSLHLENIYESCDKVQLVAFSNDDRLMAIVRGNGEIVVWDIIAKRQVGPVLHGHGKEEVIDSVAFSPDNCFLASASWGKVVNLWTLSYPNPDLNEVRTVIGNGRYLEVLSGTDSKSAAKTATIINLTTGAELLKQEPVWCPLGIDMSQEENPPSCSTVSLDGRYLAVMEGSDHLRVLDTSDGTWHHSHLPIPGILRFFSADGLNLVFNTENRKDFIVLDIKSGDITAPYLAERIKAIDSKANIVSAALSSDLSRAAIGYDNGRLDLFETSSGKVVFTHSIGEAKSYSEFAFSADGRRGAWGNSAEKEILIDTADGKLIAEMPFYPDVVPIFRFSPKNRILAAYTDLILGQVNFWNANTGKPFIDENFENDLPVVFDQNDTMMAIGGKGRLSLWNLAEGKQLMAPIQTSSWFGIQAMAFNDEGTLFAWNGEHDQYSLLDLATRSVVGDVFSTHLGAMIVPDSYAGAPVVDELAFSSDGRNLIAVKTGGVDVRPTDPEEWIKLACARAGRNLTQEEWTKTYGNVYYRKTCPDNNVHETAIKHLVKTVNEFGKQGASRQSLALLKQAVEWSRGVMDYQIQNDICWAGGITGNPKIVLRNCEEAVRLSWQAPEMRDSRGVVLAQVGNLAGALADFEAFMEKAKKPDSGWEPAMLKERSSWIEMLKKGQNSFNDETLAKLRATETE